MAQLIDTSILGRLANAADAFHATAARAVIELHRRGESLHITSQNLIEFRSVATRPTFANGLGLSPSEAEAKAAAFESAFALLPENPAIFLAWKALVASSGVTGKQVQDARLVAVCHAHAVSYILTFNTSHFARLAGFGPGVVVVDPLTV